MCNVRYVFLIQLNQSLNEIYIYRINSHLIRDYVT